MTKEEIVLNNRHKYIGMSKHNNQGLLMTITDYINTRNIIVEFEDGEKRKTSLGLFKRGSVKKEIKRIGAESYNLYGSKMIVVEYNSYSDIIVEFQDKWATKVHTTWGAFLRREVKNPYDINKYGAMLGNTHGLSSTSKEIQSWYNILLRTRDVKYQLKHPTYLDCIISEDWLLFENYYLWLIKQDNYEQWKKGEGWAVDKDILIKHNKTYSSDTCCLVPRKINNLFLRQESTRGLYPIGVILRKNGFFEAQCNNPYTNKQQKLGLYHSAQDAFNAYKKYKEDIIKKIADEEFINGNISNNCYLALKKYEVEMDD